MSCHWFFYYSLKSSCWRLFCLKVQAVSNICFLITYSNIRTNLSLDISFLLWAVIWSEGTGVMDRKCINVQNLWNCPTFCEMFPRNVSVMWCYEFKFDLSLLQRSLESTGSKLQFGAIISQDLGGFLFISVFVIDDEGTDCFWPQTSGGVHSIN